MKLKAIVAVTYPNMGIGMDDNLPWHIPDELKHFKETTMGDNVIMGRKTYEAIGRPLPGRDNIIMANNRFRDWNENVVVVHSMGEAINTVTTETAWVIGGGTIYNLFIDHIDELVISTINGDYRCNRFFPRSWHWIMSNFNQYDSKVHDDFTVRYLKRKNGTKTDI